MFRLSPRRSHRSQGFKVKHALQLFLLVCVSMWLLYQVRHSREKKAEFRVAKESIKLGRKDLLPRIIPDNIIITHVPHKDDHTKITDHPNPQGTANANTETTTEKHRLVERETDRRWDPLYAKQHIEDRKEDAKGKEEEENKDEEESKEHENAETESEENKETEENSNEGKESGEENEGEESKEEAGESESDEHDEAAREVHYNADDASSAVAHESHNTTAEPENSDSKPHEFVSWSNTNSTEAYIHQEERARNMIETQNETDDNIDGVEGNNSTTESDVDTSHPFSTIAKDINDSSRQNLTSDSTLTNKSNSSANGQVLNSNPLYPAAKSSGKFRATLFRRHARMGAKKQEGISVLSSNSNTSAGAGASDGDDVQKLKEEVDYLSVIRKKENENNKLKEVVDKKDESSDENTRFYNTESSQSQEDTNNATSDSFLDTSILQEEKDARTDLETLPGSLTAGGNGGQEAAAE